MKRLAKSLTLCIGLLMPLTVERTLYAADQGQGPGTESSNISEASNWYDATTDNAKATSTGQFEITVNDPTDPDDKDDKDGKLTLDEVPDMNFGKTTVRKVSDEGVTLPLINGIVELGESKGKRAFDGSINQIVQVSDYRGTGEGWHVTVKLGTFNSTTHTNLNLDGFTLNLKPKARTADNEDTPLVDTVSVPSGQMATLFVNAKEEKKGQGKNIYDLTSDTTLTINKQNLTVDRYQADVEWTLINAPSE